MFNGGALFSEASASLFEDVDSESEDDFDSSLSTMKLYC